MVNAGKLQGKLLLVWGELDTNVDPSSSMQVVNALIKANKSFDMLVMPGEDHPAGRQGTERAVRRPEALGLLRAQPARRRDAALEHPARRNAQPAWKSSGAANGTGSGGGSDMFGPSWESVLEGWNARRP